MPWARVVTMVPPVATRPTTRRYSNVSTTARDMAATVPPGRASAARRGVRSRCGTPANRRTADHESTDQPAGEQVAVPGHLHVVGHHDVAAGSLHRAEEERRDEPRSARNRRTDDRSTEPQPQHREQDVAADREQHAHRRAHAVDPERDQDVADEDEPSD